MNDDGLEDSPAVPEGVELLTVPAMRAGTEPILRALAALRLTASMASSVSISKPSDRNDTVRRNRSEKAR